MRFLSLAEVLRLHQALLEQSGGAQGLLDLGALESAVAQPLATFDGGELYPSLEEKAAALCFSLVSNHPFADGNKRIAHAAMEVFLRLNGRHLESNIEEQESLMLGLAAGEIERSVLVQWVREHLRAANP